MDRPKESFDDEFEECFDIEDEVETPESDEAEDEGEA